MVSSAARGCWKGVMNDLHLPEHHPLTQAPGTNPRLSDQTNDPDDPRIHAIRALRCRAERERTGLFFTEGLRFVAQAVEYNARIERLVVCPELLLQPFGHGLVRRLKQAGTP